LIGELFNEGHLNKDDIARIGKKCEVNENSGASQLKEMIEKKSRKEIIR